MSFRSAFIFVIHVTLQLANLAFWAAVVFMLGIAKLLVPIQSFRRSLLFIMHNIMFIFGKISIKLIRYFNDATFDYRVSGQLDKHQWYLLIANHLSYLDIILLIEFAATRIPPPKFFLKRELIWLPFVGIAAWAMDMPFMRRYSQAFIAKHPHLKGKDIETTRRSCEKYKDTPTTIINFVEGTRYTAEKHRLKGSPYQCLLPPKAGGIAFTLAAMSSLFTHILDVSLIYPKNKTHPMMDMLSGRMKTIIIDVQVLSVPEHAGGDYFNDAEYKTVFQNWLNELWLAKDARIQHLTSR